MYILLIISALFALILVIPVRVFITVNLSEQEVKLRYAFLKLTLYPKPQTKGKSDKGNKKEEPEKEKRKFDLKFVFKLLTESKDVITEFLEKFISYLIKRSIKVSELNIGGKFGTGDPAYTGMLCGGVYASVYNIVAKLENAAGLKKHEVNLNPDFDNACFSFGAYAELTTRLWHFLVMMIIALKYGIKFILIYRKLRKEFKNG